MNLIHINHFPIVAFFILISNQVSLPQIADDEVKKYLEKLESGDKKSVFEVLPELVSKYQNHPAVLYLQGRITSNAIEAVKFYQSIVDNFPNSEWADDALYKIHQYYYAVGLYRSAELKLEQLKKHYPNSPYITGKPITSPSKEDSEYTTTPLKENVKKKPEVTEQKIVEEYNSQKRTYTLQVGAFSTVKNAQKVKSFFEDSGYNVEITNRVRGGKSLFLVWVGNFLSYDEAKKIADEIKSKYKMDSMVIERY